MPLFLLMACTPSPPGSAPTPAPATVEPNDTADTGDPVSDTDTPPPPPTAEGPQCTGGPHDELLLGNDGIANFEPYRSAASFELSGARMDLTVRVEGLDVTQQITTVFRVGRPGGATTDTIASRILQCVDGYGWISTQIALPDGSEPGDQMELTVSFTDRAGDNASASVLGTLSPG